MKESTVNQIKTNTYHRRHDVTGPRGYTPFPLPYSSSSSPAAPQLFSEGGSSSSGTPATPWHFTPTLHQSQPISTHLNLSQAYACRTPHPQRTIRLWTLDSGLKTLDSGLCVGPSSEQSPARLSGRSLRAKTDRADLSLPGTRRNHL